MTKDDVLNRWRDDSKFPHLTKVVYEKSDVSEMLDEYAELIAIEFADWINGSKYQAEFISAFLPNEWKHEETGEHKTTKELFQLFLKSKQQSQ